MKIHLAENIRQLRKARGMMQEQLAEALGVSVGAVSKWERGAAVPDLAYILELADLFGVSLDALLGYEMQNNAASATEARIHQLQQSKRFDEAALEAEKALLRYPRIPGRWNGPLSFWSAPSFCCHKIPIPKSARRPSGQRSRSACWT